jgi:hypothetical protein
VEIYDSVFESNTAGSDVSRSKSSLRSFMNFLCFNSWRGTWNYLKGGAIDATSGADVKIYTSTFESNSADDVSG